MYIYNDVLSLLKQFVLSNCIGQLLRSYIRSYNNYSYPTHFHSSTTGHLCGLVKSLKPIILVANKYSEQSNIIVFTIVMQTMHWMSSQLPHSNTLSLFSTVTVLKIITAAILLAGVQGNNMHTCNYVAIAIAYNYEIRWIAHSAGMSDI